MKSMTATKLLVIITLTLALLGLKAEQGSAQARRKILVAYVAPGLTQSIPWITKEAGILAKHGVEADVVLLTGSPRIIQTLLAGDIDYALGGVSSVLRARIRGADPVIVATTTNYTSQGVLIRPDSPLQRLQDLKGKTVGVTQYGSQGDTFFRDALKKIGLRPDADVSIIHM
jgi:NitT/TauT family transport system substrate-binding protein